MAWGEKWPKNDFGVKWLREKYGTPHFTPTTRGPSWWEVASLVVGVVLLVVGGGATLGLG